MTRINLVPPRELCDQHLIAEYRELPRIPFKVAKGWAPTQGVPDQYVMGPGHVKFFANKIKFLLCRHDMLRREMQRRGFEAKSLKVEGVPDEMMGDYHPDKFDLMINRLRILERVKGFKKPARWTCTTVPKWIM